MHNLAFLNLFLEEEHDSAAVFWGLLEQEIRMLPVDSIEVIDWFLLVLSDLSNELNI